MFFNTFTQTTREFNHHTLSGLCNKGKIYKQTCGTIGLSLKSARLYLHDFFRTCLTAMYALNRAIQHRALTRDHCFSNNKLEYVSIDHLNQEFPKLSRTRLSYDPHTT